MRRIHSLGVWSPLLLLTALGLGCLPASQPAASQEPVEAAPQTPAPAPAGATNFAEPYQALPPRSEGGVDAGPAPDQGELSVGAAVRELRSILTEIGAEGVPLQPHPSTLCPCTEINEVASSARSICEQLAENSALCRRARVIEKEIARNTAICDCHVGVGVPLPPGLGPGPGVP